NHTEQRPIFTGAVSSCLATNRQTSRTLRLSTLATSLTRYCRSTDAILFFFLLVRVKVFPAVIPHSGIQAEPLLSQKFHCAFVFPKRAVKFVIRFTAKP